VRSKGCDPRGERTGGATKLQNYTGWWAGEMRATGHKNNLPRTYLLYMHTSLTKNGTLFENFKKIAKNYASLERYFILLSNCIIIMIRTQFFY
jgi:hypothetical protein